MVATLRSVVSPTAVQPDGSSLHCMLDLQLGPHMGWKGEHILYVGRSLNTLQATEWVAEGEWGATQQEHAEPNGSSPGQMTSQYVATSTRVPHGIPLRQPARQCRPSDGVAALNYLQELKIRLTWATLSGLN